MNTKKIHYNQGDTINGLTFIQEVDKRGKRERRAIFRCTCGRNFECIIRSIVSGNTTSCGCWGAKSRSIRFTKHGLRHHEVYKIWSGVKTRCYNKNRADYKYYGGSGITLSDEFHDFKTWFDYVTTLPMYEMRKELNLTIDRIDVTKNYERGNLRWATRLVQSLNQRRNSLFS